jgi:hypothetical protein
MAVGSSILLGAVALAAVVAAPPAPACPVELAVQVLTSEPLEPEQFRSALSAELGRPVTLEVRAQCDGVAVVVDVGVVTITVRAAGLDGRKRVLPRKADTAVVQERVWLAAGLLRKQLEAHTAELAAVALPAPAAHTPAAAPRPAPQWWFDIQGTSGILARGFILAGFEAGAHWSDASGLFHVGLAAGFAQSVVANEPSTRWQLMPEVGVHGGPGRFRLGVLVGAGLLVAREPTLGDAGFTGFAALRARGLVGVTLSRGVELALTGGIVLASDASALPRSAVWGGLSVSFGLAP